jgi:hypothetical protein
MQTAQKGAIDPQSSIKLRLFIFTFARNISLQTLLNQDITGSPERQQETSLPPERSRAGSFD